MPCADERAGPSPEAVPAPSPLANGKGGRNPYQVFAAEHVLAAKFIRIAQSLGMSLKDLATIGEERRTGRITSGQQIDILGTQLARLEAKTKELDGMKRYLRARIDWIAAGECGAPPDFEKYAPCTLEERGTRIRRRKP